MKEATLGVSEFKAKCLHLLDEVAERGTSLVITKQGKPIARVEPILGRGRSLRGSWKSLVKIKGDLVNFHDEWGDEA